MEKEYYVHHVVQVSKTPSLHAEIITRSVKISETTDASAAMNMEVVSYYFSQNGKCSRIMWWQPERKPMKEYAQAGQELTVTKVRKQAQVY